MQKRKHRYINIIGNKYNRLTVLGFHHIDRQHNRVFWECQCECGIMKVVRGDHLKSGAIKSCGCLNKESLSIRGAINGKLSKKHNLSNHRLYRIWAGMKTRCYNSGVENYKYYGKKGIKVCNEWLDKKEGFINFYNWSISNGYDNTLTLDRIDNEKDYCPENCRWANVITQANNKTNNHYVTYDGTTKTLTQWANIVNISRDTLYDRLGKLNWGVEKALNTPIREKREHNENNTK